MLFLSKPRFKEVKWLAQNLTAMMQTPLCPVPQPVGLTRSPCHLLILSEHGQVLGLGFLICKTNEVRQSFTHLGSGPQLCAEHVAYSPDFKRLPVQVIPNVCSNCLILYFSQPIFFLLSLWVLGFEWLCGWKWRSPSRGWRGCQFNSVEWQDINPVVNSSCHWILGAWNQKPKHEASTARGFYPPHQFRNCFQPTLPLLSEHKPGYCAGNNLR